MLKLNKRAFLLVFSCFCILASPSFAYQRITDGNIVAYLPETPEEITDILPMDIQAEIVNSAQTYQNHPPAYNPDAYHVEMLQAGDTIYGMIGYQSNYYTDQATYNAAVAAHDLKSLNRVLQIASHNDTVRTGVARYRLKVNMFVAKGQCLANPQYGNGGGTQYVLPMFLVQGDLFDRNNNQINLSCATN